MDLEIEVIFHLEREIIDNHFLDFSVSVHLDVEYFLEVASDAGGKFAAYSFAF